MAGNVAAVAPPSSQRIYGYVLEFIGNGNGTNVSRIFGIGQETVIIGRGSHNHIRLNQRIFSRLHATLSIKEEDGNLKVKLKNESKQRNATIVDSYVLESEQTVVLGSSSLFKLQGHSFKWIENDGSIEALKKHKAPFIYLAGNQTRTKPEDDESTQDAKTKPMPAVESPSQATPTPSTASPKRRRNSQNQSLELRKAAHRRSYRSSVRPVRQSVPLATLAEVVQEETDDEDHRQSSDLILFSPDTPNNTNETNDNAGNYSMITHAATPPFADKSNQTIEEDEEEQEDFGEEMQILLKTPVQKTPNKRISERVLSTSIIRENIKPSVEVATPRTSTSRVNSPAKQFSDTSNNNVDVERRRSSRSSVRNSTTAAEDTEEFSDALEELTNTPVQNSPSKRASKKMPNASTTQICINESIQATPGCSTSPVDNSPKNIKLGGRRRLRSSILDPSEITDAEEDYSDSIPMLMKTPQKTPVKRSSKRGLSSSIAQDNIEVSIQASNPGSPVQPRLSAKKIAVVGGRQSLRSSNLDSSVATDEEDYSDSIPMLMKTPVQKTPVKRSSKRGLSSSIAKDNTEASIQASNPESPGQPRVSAKKIAVVGGRQSLRSSNLDSSVATDEEDYSDSIPMLMKTPGQKTPVKRSSKRGLSSSIAQDNIEASIQASNPGSPVQPRLSATKIAVVGGSSHLDSSVATDEEDYSDSISKLMKTPVQKTPVKRSSTRGLSTSIAQNNIEASIQAANPESPGQPRVSAEKIAVVGGRQSLRSSNLDSSVATDEEDYSDSIPKLMKTPGQETPVKRSSKRGLSTSIAQDNIEVSILAATPGSSGQPRLSTKKISVVGGRRSLRSSNLDSIVSSDTEEDYSDSIPMLMKTPAQKTPVERSSTSGLSTSIAQNNIEASIQAATPGSPGQPRVSAEKIAVVGGRRSLRSSNLDSIVSSDTEDDYSDSIPKLIKTPGQETPVKRSSKRGLSTSIAQDNIEVSILAATPGSSGQPRLSTKKIAVAGGRRSLRSSNLDSIVSSDTEDDYSDSIPKLMKTPGQETPVKRSSKRGLSTSIAQDNIEVSILAATPGSSGQPRLSTKKISVVGGRRSLRSSNLDSIVSSDTEEDYSDSIPMLMKTPGQKTSVKRSSKRGLSTSIAQDNIEVSIQAANAGSSDQPRLSAKKISVVGGRRSLRSSNLDSIVSSDSEDDYSDSIPKLMKTPGQETSIKRSSKRGLSTSIAQDNIEVSIQAANTGSPAQPRHSAKQIAVAGGRRSLRSSNLDSIVSSDTEDDYSDSIPKLMKTPGQETPVKRSSKRGLSTSIAQDNIEVSILAATPGSSGQPRLSTKKISVVGGRRSLRSSNLDSIVSSDTEEDYSDSIPMLMKTPGQKTSVKRSSKRGLSTSIAQDNIEVSIQAANAGSSDQPRLSAKKISVVGGRRSLRSSNLDSIVSSDSEDDYSDSIPKLMKTPGQETSIKRSSKRGLSTSIAQDNIEVSIQAANTGSPAQPRHSAKQIAVIGGRRSLQNSNLDSSVATDEEDYSDSIPKLMKTPGQETPVKRSSKRGLSSTKGQASASTSQEKTTKRPRRGKAQGNDLQVEGNTEVETNEQGSVSAPPEIHAKRTRRAQIQEKATDLQVKSNIEVEEESMNKRESVSVSTKKPVKRTRRGKAEVEDVQVNNNTEMEVKSTNTNEQENVPEASKKPIKRARRGKTKDVQVEESEEVSIREHERDVSPQEKTTKRPRRGKAQGNDLQVEGNTEVETNEQGSVSAPPEIHAKRTRRAQIQKKTADLQVKSNTEVEEESMNKQESVSVSTKKPVKRTRRGKAEVEDVQVNNNTEMEVKSTNEQENVPEASKKPIKRARRGKTKDVQVEESEEVSIREHERDVSPQEKTTKRPRRGKAQGNDLQVEGNTEVETNEQGSVSAPPEIHAKRTRRAQIQKKAADLQVKSNTEVEEESMNKQESVSVSTKKPVKRTRRGKAEVEDVQVNNSTEMEVKSTNEQENVPEASKKPVKRARRGKTKDVQVEESEEVLIREHERDVSPQEKSTKRPRRGKAQVKAADLQVEDDTEVENGRSTIEQGSVSAIPETLVKQTRRANTRRKVENLPVKSNSEVEVESNRGEESVSVPSKKPVKRTRRGQAKDLKGVENEEESTRVQESSSVVQDKPAKGTRRGQTKDKDVQTEDNVEVEEPKRTTRAKRGNEEIHKAEPTRVMRRRK